MECYLCGAEAHSFRKGKVRDDPDLKIRECTKCGLVSLSSTDHIKNGHYENSGMHAEIPQTIESWLRDTEHDDQRRVEQHAAAISNKQILDFGCGAAGFLVKAKSLATCAHGVEPESRVRKHWEGHIQIYGALEEASFDYDLISAFHVIEHLKDPRAVLRELARHLDRDGRIVIEVPSADDALLTLFECEPFQRFTYWSQHLYLFNPNTLHTLATQAGLRVVAIEQFQRYPLSNHLHWLSHHIPGGHVKWSFLDSPELSRNYSSALASVGKCDTLIGYFEKHDRPS